MNGWRKVLFLPILMAAATGARGHPQSQIANRKSKIAGEQAPPLLEILEDFGDEGTAEAASHGL